MALEIAFKALVVWLGILLLSGLILLDTYLALPWMGRAPVARYLAIGIAWLCLTVMLEFGFGRIVRGKPWSRLLAAYRFTGGNLWPIVLLVTASDPCVACKWRGWA